MLLSGSRNGKLTHRASESFPSRTCFLTPASVVMVLQKYMEAGHELIACDVILRNDMKV